MLKTKFVNRINIPTGIFLTNILSGFLASLVIIILMFYLYERNDRRHDEATTLEMAQKIAVNRS